MRPTDPRRARATRPGPLDLFAALPLADVVLHDLERRMSGPTRHYHGMAHLDLLWRRHRAFAGGAGLRAEDDTPIALAIAFHDAVYDSGARDNEARSAALWLAVSAGGTVCGEADRQWVAETILATADHLAALLDPDLPEHRARQWMLDLDLSPLGEEPHVFDANMLDLAAEMPDGTPQEKRTRLVAGLQHYATARPLYRSAALQAAFEAPAQQNIARQLGRPEGSTAFPAAR